MFYNFIAKYQKQPTHISIKKRLNQLWFLLNGVLSCEATRQLSQVLIQRLPRFSTVQKGWGSWCRTEYTICPYLWKDKQKEYILNVYTSIGYIWKNKHKEASNPGSWGEEQGIRGERYNFHSIALVSIESSTMCTNCLPPKLM